MTDSGTKCAWVIHESKAVQINVHHSNRRCLYVPRVPGSVKNLHNNNNNKSCRRTASSPVGYILYCNIFIIKPYNIGHTDLDVFVCKSFCHIDIIIQV